MTLSRWLVAIVLAILVTLTCTNLYLVVSPLKTSDGEEGVRFSGLINNCPGMAIGGPAASRLARKAKNLKVDPAIDDDQLKAILKAVLDRAEQGEVDAATAVFDLAALQRQPTQAPGALPAGK